MTRMNKHLTILALGIPGVCLCVAGWWLMEKDVLNSLFAVVLFCLGLPLLLAAAGIWIARRNRTSAEG